MEVYISSASDARQTDEVRADRQWQKAKNAAISALRHPECRGSFQGRVTRREINAGCWCKHRGARGVLYLTRSPPGRFAGPRSTSLAPVVC